MPGWASRVATARLQHPDVGLKGFGVMGYSIDSVAPP